MIQQATSQGLVSLAEDSSLLILHANKLVKGAHSYMISDHRAGLQL